MTAPAPPLLRVEGLCKSFGGVVATDRLDLEVRYGEAHAVIGPNGAGKSTLIAQLCGELRPSAGRIRFAGRDITDLPAHARVGIGLARSFQVTSLLASFTAAENVQVALRPRFGNSLVFWRDAARDADLDRRAQALLAEVGLVGRGDVIAAELAHGEQRQLELAMALASRPRLLLLDEPMAGVGHEEAQRMVELLLRLKQECPMLLVEHDMDAVFRIADRITVLVNGRAIASGPPATIRADPRVREAYLGEGGTGLMAPLLAVTDLHAGYGASAVLFGISLEVAAGEVLALLGRNGMGKTTTVRAIMGLVRPTRGSDSLAGRPQQGRASYQIARAGIGLVPEGRQIFPNLTVEENLVATAANRRSQAAAWTLPRVYELFGQLEERRRHLGSQLSGGEQQMLAIGRALMTNPDLLILDEATEGLAPLIRAEIWRCLGRLKAGGQSILLIDKNVGRTAAARRPPRDPREGPGGLAGQLRRARGEARNPAYLSRRLSARTLARDSCHSDRRRL